MVKCKCTFAIRMLGEGCRYCQPQEYIDRMHEQMADDAVSAYNRAIKDVAAAIRIGADELDKLRGEHEAALALLREARGWIVDVRDIVLYPLASASAAKISLSAECFGKYSVGILERVSALLANQSPPAP